VNAPRHPDRRHLRPVGPVRPRLVPPPLDLDRIFLPPPDPADPSPPPLYPSWPELRQISGRTTRDCTHPEHGRPAMALTRLLDLVIRRAADGASVISFADLHSTVAPLLIGETDA
jgi:hypothetical protein